MEAQMRKVLDKSNRIKAENYQSKMIEEVSNLVKGRKQMKKLL